jgi:hypothetical protein
VNDHTQAARYQAAIDRKQKLLILAADTVHPHLSKAGAAITIGIEKLFPVTLYIAAPERPPRNQMMHAMFVHHEQARRHQRPLIYIIVIWVIPLMIDAKVKWVISVNFIKAACPADGVILMVLILSELIFLVDEDGDLGTARKVGQKLGIVVGDT